MVWLGLAGLCNVAAPPAAADFASGLLAFERGDWAAALAEWLPLAESGVIEAQFNVGLMHQHGQGVPVDLAQALQWYLKAAGGGFARAQYRAGEMYETGQGIERDLVQAHVWFNLAAAQKFQDAKKRRRRVAHQMTPEQIAEAELFAREWKQQRKSPS